MRALSVCYVLALVGPAFGDEPKNERVTKLFESENYSVSWGVIPVFAADAELEISDGNGHGNTLGWMWFKPGKDGVDVLAVKYNRGWKPYDSKYQPDTAPVTVKHARLKTDAYAELLKDLAVVEAAKLNPLTTGGGHSTNDFWVSAQLTDGKKTLLDFDWVGYEADRHEIDYAKPRATVRLARQAVEKLDFKDHKLTEAERASASEKFARDWKRYKEKESHWWVKERSIITIGVVGDAAAFPTLREILESKPKKELDLFGKPPKDRFGYYAINAVTRLTGKDVRDKPVEEMDVEKVRSKVLELIKDKK